MHYLIILVFVFIISINNSFSQSSEIVSNLKPGYYSGEWIMYKSNAFTDIMYRYSDCSNTEDNFFHEFILLKVVNKTDEKIQVTWKYSTRYDNKRVKYAYEENRVNVFLNAKESKEGSCDRMDKTKLKVFVRNKNHKTKITDYKIIGFREVRIN